MAKNGSERLKFNIFDIPEFLNREKNFLEHFRKKGRKNKFGTLLTHFWQKIEVFTEKIDSRFSGPKKLKILNWNFF